MSSCNLSLTLDRTDATYRVGDRVQGLVEVDVAEEVHCKGLTVDRRWKTHGRGRVDKGRGESLELFSGTWKPGHYRYAFGFDTVEPCTYHGHNLNVDWYLSARADIPWARDPKVEKEYLVELGPSHDESSVQTAGTMDRLLSGARGIGNSDWYAAKNIALGVHSTLFLVATVFLWDRISVSMTNLPFWAIVVMSLGFPCFYSHKAVVALLWRAVIGSIRFAVGIDEVSRGSRVPCLIRIATRRRQRVGSVSIHICAEEEVTSGSGTNTTTIRKVVYDEHITVEPSSRIGHHLDYTPRVIVPHDAWPSFKSESNELHWFLEARVEVAKMPTWTARRKLVVRA